MPRKLSIYVVDDSAQLNELKRMLNALGHTVAGVSSTIQNVLQNMSSLDCDLIIINILLGGKPTGLSLAEKLIQETRIPVILMTAYPDDITIGHVKKLGNYGILNKPFSQSDLKAEITFTYQRFEKFQRLERETITSKRNLKETEQFFKQVVDNVGDIIYRIDLNGGFTYLNPSALKSTGYEKELLYQTHSENLVQKEYLRRIRFFFLNMLRKNIRHSYVEVPVRLNGGQRIWLGQNIHLLRRNNKPVGFQVVARDITKEIEFKQELIKARNIAEHTAELKAQFLANMSHEIRTPLNGIIGIVKLLEKTDLNQKQQTYLNAVSSSSEQLMGIINDILDLSKIDSGKMELNKVEFNFNELVRSLIDVMEIKAGFKGIRLRYHIDQDVPEILIGDPIVLNQILYNLIGNSLKFTQEGEVSLKVIRREENSGSNCTNIELIVTDTGVGMKKEVQEKIFEAFTQAESSTTRKFGGTGLGLTIVKKLIDLQNGTIFVESEEGFGTQFHVNLCFDNAPKNAGERNLKSELNYQDLKAKRILVVEDNFINQMVTKDLLEDAGAYVTLAENGRLALDRLNEGEFDIILMDMQMPVMDGFETMQHIRSTPTIAQIPILALTANAINSEIQKCMECGASDYLSKPFLPEDLYLRIIKLTRSTKDNDTSSVVDLDVLSSYTNGKEALMAMTLKELSKLLMVEKEELLQKIKNADQKAIRARIHKLKPNFQMIGLNRMTDMARLAEKEEDSDVLIRLAKEILNELPRILEGIEFECNQLAKTTEV